MLSTLRSWTRGVLLGLVAIALVAFVGFMVIDAGIAEHYSRGWHSRSSAEAAAKGILVRRPVVIAESLVFRGAPVTIADAWIEHVTRVEAPYYVWRRTVRDSAVRLVVLTRGPRAEPADYCDEVSFADGRRFGHSAGDWVATSHPAHAPFPDTIRLVVERSGCDSTRDDAFAPFDSMTLIAECRHRVTAAEESAYRATVSRIASREGVVVHANPAPHHPCFQLGVTTRPLRDTLASALRRAGVPMRVVTFFHVTHMPEDDIVAGARMGSATR